MELFSKTICENVCTYFRGKIVKKKGEFMTMQQVEIGKTKAKLEEKLASYFGVTPSDASIDQMYKAVSMSVLDILLEKKKEFNRKVKVQLSLIHI